MKVTEFSLVLISDENLIRVQITRPQISAARKEDRWDEPDWEVRAGRRLRQGVAPVNLSAL